MEPLRRCQTSQHFYENSEGNWLPCDSRQRGAQKMTLMEVPEKLLKCPDVTYVR